MIDEDRVALGLGDLLDSEILLHLPEVHVRVAGEVVGDDEVGLRHDLVASPDRVASRDAGQNLLCDRVTHGRIFLSQAAAEAASACVAGSKPNPSPSRRM